MVSQNTTTTRYHTTKPHSSTASAVCRLLTQHGSLQKVSFVVPGLRVCSRRNIFIGICCHKPHSGTADHKQQTEPHKPRGSVGMSGSRRIQISWGGSIVPYFEKTRTHTANATQIHKTTTKTKKAKKQNQERESIERSSSPVTSLEPRSAREGSAGEI